MNAHCVCTRVKILVIVVAAQFSTTLLNQANQVSWYDCDVSWYDCDVSLYDCDASWYN